MATLKRGQEEGVRAGSGLGIQGGAEGREDRVGGPVGASRGLVEFAPDQNQLVPGTLPPDGLGSVEMTAEETVWNCEKEHREVRRLWLDHPSGLFT